ncbi:MAG: ABC transporter permease [Actinobacteria bacterium]|nr:ABC transporter permease [Actinomycetota bacterium]
MNFFEYVGANSDRLIGLTIDHIWVVGVSVAIAAFVGVSTGIATYRTNRPRTIALNVAGTFLTIPSFALFVIFIGPFGLGAKPAIVALAMYGILPILRNTITGLRGVDPAVIESAQGMGMPRWQRLLWIELPLAWPVIVTGIRVSTLILVGIAAIAAIVNGPGLGDPIFVGLARIGSPAAVNLVLSGVLGVIVVAILFDALYSLLIRLTTSRGIR